jgi:release factor glutamine methyltransferase
MPADSRDHEPLATVDGGVDGLDLLRRVAAIAPRWLRPGGIALCEVGDDQVGPALDAFAAAGLQGRVHVDEERGATAVSAVSAASAVSAVSAVTGRA